ncbi:MAG: hypothetical protein QXS45_03685 [Sulfolobales archaeon]
MSRVAYEILGSHLRRSLLHSRKLLSIKILYLIISISLYMLRFIPLEILVIVANSLLIIMIRAYRTLATASFSWAMLSLIIILVDMISGTISSMVYFNLLYSYATLTTILLFYLTTPPSHLRDVFGMNIFTLSYSLLRSFLRDLIEIIDSYRVRGFELGIFRIHRYTPLLYQSLEVALIREELLRDSLKARGFEH